MLARSVRRERAAEEDSLGKKTFLFVRHKASRAHYDLRLRWKENYHTFLIPKGLSKDPSEKRLAIQANDLPDIDPSGEAAPEGTVVIDSGTYREDFGEAGLEGRMDDGHFSVWLEGRTLRGGYAFTRLEDNWLVVKKEDEWAGEGDVTEALKPQAPSPRPKPREEEHLEPMLATLTDERFSDPDWVFERKLDGERRLSYLRPSGVTMLSRNGKELNNEYPEIVEALRPLSSQDMVVDGELVAFEGGKTSFAKLQERMHVKDPQEALERGVKVYYNLFDLLRYRGQDVRRKPLVDRKQLLAESVERSDLIRMTEHVPEDGERLYKEACESGWEGIIAKRASSPYQGRRSEDWLKMKCTLRQEFVVGGFTEPKGRRPHLGALFIGYYEGDELRFAGKVGTGFTAEQLECLHRELMGLEVPEQPFHGPHLRHHEPHWVRPELVAEVEFTSWTEDGRLRHPSYVALRQDKPPEEVVRERPRVVARPEGPRSYGGLKVELSNQNKVLFPRDGFTKGDIVDYYSRISSTMLPHMRGRPVVMVRYPDGLGGEGFFQKDASSYFPDWIRRVTVEKKGGTVDHVVCEKEADLVYLANLACITPHIWLSREGNLDHPDRMILDMDPPGRDFSLVRSAALMARDILEDVGLKPFVMTTGSRGLHVTVPLDREADFDEVRAFAQEVAEQMVRRDDRFTTERSKADREGRLLVDTFRNSYAQTGVAPYALRAKDGAPVATPLDWKEVEAEWLGPQSFTLANIFERLDSKADPWKEIDRHAGSVREARDHLENANA